MQHVMSGVIIDATVPRTPYERTVAMFDYLIVMPGSIMDDKTEALDPGHATMNHGPEQYESDRWAELEDEIIEEINNRLPDGWVCVVGEFQPGDVVVREED